MGQSHAEITPELAAWICAQKFFFVATAPLSSGGHVSGAETMAHLRENGCIRDVLPGARAIVRVEVEQVRTSCGWGVPVFVPGGDRVLLPEWSENRLSLDGLPSWG